MKVNCCLFYLKLIVLLLLRGACGQWIIHKSNHPEQLHLSLGTNESEMVITWATSLPIPDTAQIEYSLKEDQLYSSVNAEVTHFIDGANFYTFRALMISLEPDSRYYYRVGSNGSSWSEVHQFKTHPNNSNWNPRFSIYGDLGYNNAQSLPFLAEQVNMYDAIFHLGDMAYDLHFLHGEIGHNFMRSIEKVAARVPYMVCPGNHEAHNNFSHYDARFTMIGDRNRPNHHASLTSRLNNHFHSMDIGPAHIIMFSTEFYYYTNYGTEQIARQFRALEEDLAKANASRAERPWIIVMGHRPLYCLMVDLCNLLTLEREVLRKGVHLRSNKHFDYGLEDLFFKYGVDLQFYGHEHFYARLLPLYNFTIMSGSNNANSYENPKGPVMIVTGSAGNLEMHSQLNPLVNRHKWIARYHREFGYTRLTFKDRRRILLEQTSVKMNGEAIDQIEIVKEIDQS